MLLDQLFAYMEVFAINLLALLALVFVLVLVDTFRRRRAQSQLVRRFSETRQSAEQGDVGAQYNLGRMFDLGQGVAYDDTKAGKWFHKAAEQGHAEAQFRLGLIYEGIDLARGTSESAATAAGWYRKAAEQGYAQAQFFLGTLYEDGRGVAQDEAMAAAWRKKAAERGLLLDRRKIIALALGTGGADKPKQGRKKKEDSASGCIWMPLVLVALLLAAGIFSQNWAKSEFTQAERGAEQGDAEAQYTVGVMYDSGRGVREDGVRAAERLRMAAGQGHAKAQLYLGVLYDKGRGVPHSKDEAVAWLRKAAAQRHLGGAVAEAAEWFLTAITHGHNAGSAAEWLHNAAEQGDAAMQTRLGVMYLHGLSVPQRPYEAMLWLRRAAEQGDAEAQHHLGLMYMQNQAPSRSSVYSPESKRMYYLKGAEWLRQAAEQGHADAQCHLGIMYHTGQGVVQNTQKACALWHDAVRQGNTQAVALYNRHCN